MATKENDKSKQTNTKTKEQGKQDNNNQVNKEKMKALQLTLDKIEKGYGKGTIMKMGDKAIADVPSISSGSIALDNALGIGGYPRGRVVEIYGPESSGKTTDRKSTRLNSSHYS